MLQFLNLIPEKFGLDISDSSVKIIKLKKKRGGFILHSFNEIGIKHGIVEEGIIRDEESLVRIIKSAVKTVKGKKINTKYVVASLPEEKSFSQVIQVPKMEDDELQSAVPFEAENYIPLAIDKVYLDFQKISQDKNSSRLDLLISATPKAIVDSYVSCLKKAGLVPCALELESQAIARALVDAKEDVSPVILIDFGGDNTDFIVFSGHSVRFTCSIPISSELLTSAIRDNLSVSRAEADDLKVKYGLIGDKKSKQDASEAMSPILKNLVSQIKKYINFYHDHVLQGYFPSDGKIEKIILCGGGANLKGLTNFLYGELKIPVELGDPFLNPLLNKNKNKRPISHEKSLSFATAFGLALREDT